jgi:general secretion pathway protein A
LSRDETSQYIEHRLQVAGALGEVFDAGAKRTVFRLSQGIPRLINVICDRALLGAYSQGRRLVNARLVRRAAREVSGEPDLRLSRRWLAPAIGAAALLVLASGFWSLYERAPAPMTKTQAEAAVAAEAVAAITVEAAEPVDEPDVTLGEQLAIAELLTTEESAIAELLAIWGIDPQTTMPACDYAKTLGYSCLRNRSSWLALRQLDHPAILELVDNSGHPHHVVLTSIDADQARLSIGGVAVSHANADVAEMWYGNYLLIWQPPNGVAVSLAPGIRHANVVWLRTSLAAVDQRYRAEPLGSDMYDQELEQRVRDFQRDQRLDVDGLAGQQTQIIINTLLASDNTPRLSAPQFARE